MHTRASLVIFDGDDTLWDTSGWDGQDVSTLKFIPGALAVLKDPRFRKVLVTRGESDFQNSKIDRFGVRNYFEHILICESDPEKLALFTETMFFCNTTPQRMFVVGNRVDCEIRYGNMLGVKTFWLPHGRHAKIERTTRHDKPSVELEHLSNLLMYVETA